MERLLDLIHKLIDYGKELAASLQQRASEDPHFTRRSFGTNDFARILARITRGLLLATALEARIVEIGDRLDAPAKPARAASQRAPRAPRARAQAAAEEDALLAAMPTAEEIAAQIRRRPVGAVLADICRDLGLTFRHPLWRELQDAIIHYNGNYARLVTDILDRFCPLPPRVPLLASSLPASTGPP